MSKAVKHPRIFPYKYKGSHEHQQQLIYLKQHLQKVRGTDKITDEDIIHEAIEVLYRRATQNVQLEIFLL